MSKTRIIVALLTIWLLQVRGQGVDSNNTISIYLVTNPGGLMTGDGRFFTFKSDTLSVWNNKGWFFSPGERLDTAHYTLTNSEKESILKILKSSDTLKSAINPCIMDGLILSVSYEKGDKKRFAWISNAYDDKLFTFIDIINKYVSEQFRIRYDKDELISETKECFATIQKRKKELSCQ